MVLDLSKIGQMQAQAQQQRAANPYGNEVGEITPRERNAMARIRKEVMEKYLSNGIDAMTDGDINSFEQEMADRFHGLGFVAMWDWNETPPALVIEARVDVKETDHEEIARQVSAGEYDGVKGYRRSDGSIHEDPIKKTIQ